MRVWRRSAKFFKILNIWETGGIDKRTGGESLFNWMGVAKDLSRKFFQVDYCKSGALIGFLVWIQGFPPLNKAIAKVLA